MQHGSYSVSVLVRGRPITEYHHRNAVYVEGRRGSEFQLQFRNMSTNNVLVVPSVDGLSVMDGQPAGDQSSGYVVRGLSTLTIPGWRLNNEQIAKFFFQDRNRSYATQSGHGSNVGVIGFRIFAEMTQQAPLSYGAYYPPLGGDRLSVSHSSSGWTGSGVSRSTGQLSQNASSSEMSSIGTGFGRRDNHAVRMVDFQKKSSVPDAQFVIYYDTRSNLERMGIQIKKRSSPVEVLPNPFPVAQIGCVAPPGWSG